jgi:hypothetical protein
MSRTMRLFGAALGVAAVIASASLALGAADSERPQTARAAGATAAQPRSRPTLKQLAAQRVQLFGELGSKLGKSAADVQAAVRALLADRLQKDVDAGRMTADQRDAVLKAYDAGLPGFGVPGIGFGFAGPHFGHGDRFESGRRGGFAPRGGVRPRRGFDRAHPPAAKDILAKRDQLFAALAGKLGVSADQVKAAVRGVLSDHLDQAVKNGRLTRSQADAMLKAFDTGRPPAGLRAHGMGGRWHGPPPGAPPAPPPGDVPPG